MATAENDSEQAEQAAQPGQSTARAVGRGGLAVLGAKAYFVLLGFVQQIALKQAIGMAGYGALSRVLAPANIINNVTVTSSIQGVSRAVAGGGEHREQAFRATLRVHAPLALVLAILFALLAPAYASFQGSPHIVTPLRILACVVAIYGVYAPLVGSLNGRALFTRQAALDTIFATLRTLGLIGVGLLFQRYGGAGVEGSVTGFVLATLLILPLALVWSGTGRAPDPHAPPVAAIPRPTAYLAQLLPLALAQLFANGLMQADIAVLGRFVSSGALASGLTGEGAARSADEWVGVYRFCQLFAFLPYQLVLSVAQVLFPMVARAHAENDREAVHRYVQRGARIAALACGLVVAVIVVIPASVLGVAGGAVVAERGASTLRILVLGQGAFTLFGIGTTVLASLGKERLSATLSFVLLVFLTGAVWVASSGATYGEAQLRATAWSTSATLSVGLVAMSLAVRRYSGTFIPLATFARAAGGVALAYVAGLALPRFGLLLTPFVALAVAIAYIVFLIVTGELKGADRAMLVSLVSRRRNTSR
ncbi:lipopolysaccharide biosynthesis protein [Pendulispora albinea]|uniref:Lipopolysaccharide biosynthesis protein n=1 Tax=Pendulispora albinea TaxID=2741071 RepID=A0ABZ2M196_9BACT